MCIRDSDDTIQHAGIGIAPSVAACLHQSLPRSDAGYFALNDAQQDLSAVTAACMMTKRSAFEQVGGMTAVSYTHLDVYKRQPLLRQKRIGSLP